ncbi:MAG: VOC family protein [Actinomycetota bacterium]|nr:VOC family protein [Actinomycetota bacterium]
MELAKPHLDVGLYTNRFDEVRRFYEGDLGLVYEELLKAGRGVHQHRFELRGGVLKVNDSRQPLEEASTAYRGLVVADHGASTPRHLTDPDGLDVKVMPVGHEGIGATAVRWASTDPDRLGRLLADGFDAEALGERRWRVGETVVLVEHDPGVAVGPLRARGFRYLTVQVRDVRAEHERLRAIGWQEGTAPVRLGDVAMISFVRDPDGSWIEVSQRASLTGPLPEA